MSKVIIQDSWDDDDDLMLLEYMDEHNIDYDIQDADQIRKIDELSDVKCLLADTDIIHDLLDKIEIVETYPKFFDDMYNRKISCEKFLGSQEYVMPFFMKPRHNNKEFSATIVRDKYDAAHVDQFVGDVVYIAEVVDFVSEFRMFILDDQLMGLVETTKFVMNRENTGARPPDKFIEKVLDKNEYPDCVVDVGKVGDSWSVVEVNPPCSLSSYGWNCGVYLDYCTRAWAKLIDDNQ